MVGGVIDDAGDGRRSLVAADCLGSEAEAVVRLAEAGIVSAAQQQVNRLAVAVSRVKVADCMVTAEPSLALTVEVLA
jgi:hypothetical protein